MSSFKPQPLYASLGKDFNCYLNGTRRIPVPNTNGASFNLVREPIRDKDGKIQFKDFSNCDHIIVVLSGKQIPAEKIDLNKAKNRKTGTTLNVSPYDWVFPDEEE